MRTIQVVNVRWYNATAWYGVTLASCLQKAGHPSLVAGLAGTPPLEKAREMGLPTVELPFNSQTPGKLVELWHGMDRLVRDFRPDVVNCHRGEAFVLWALMKKKHDFALVRTRGDRRLPRGGCINRWLHCRAADAVIATNTLMTRHFAEVLKVPADRLHTILGGVDTARFHADAAAREEMRKRYGYADEHVVMGLLGRMDEVKGIRESIAALAVARRLSPEAGRLRFLVIGFDSEFSTADVARWTKEAGLGDLGDIVTVTGRWTGRRGSSTRWISAFWPLWARKPLPERRWRLWPVPFPSFLPRRVSCPTSFPKSTALFPAMCRTWRREWCRRWTLPGETRLPMSAEGAYSRADSGWKTSFPLP